MPRHTIKRLLAAGAVTTVAIGVLSVVPARADNDDWHGRGDCKHDNCQRWDGHRNWQHHDDWRDRDDRYYYHSTPYYSYPPPAYGPGFGFSFGF